jgi:hypothetical protein
MSEHSAAAFFDVWHTYRKVVAANYMHHMEIRAQLGRVLLAQFASRPFSFLDLGCGDAATLAPLLASMAVQRLRMGCWLSSRCGAICPSWNKAKPIPVPIVKTHSRPLPVMTPRPWPLKPYSGFAPRF